MNSLAFATRALIRDLRAGELSVLLLAIVVAVTAMTAVGFFTDRVGRAIRLQASSVLAADLVIRAPAPIEPSFLEAASEQGLLTAQSMSFLTMVLAEDNNALANVRAVSEGYPLRGELLVSNVMFGETEATRDIPEAGTGWAEPGLLGRMNIAVGDTVTVGEKDIRITRVLEYQPNPTPGGFTNLAPGLMVNLADVPAFAVIRPGSRATYRELFAGDEENIRSFRAEIKPLVSQGARLRGVEDAGEQINAAIDRAERFLTLASLVTVILAAVATAMASRRYALRHLNSIALLKSFGATQSFIQNSTLFQLVLVIIATAGLGSALGYIAQGLLVLLASDFLNFSLPDTSLRSVLLGLVTSATITIGFALPHLLQLKNTSPIRVLRNDLPPPKLQAGVTYGVAIGMLVVMIYSIVRDLALLGYIVGGLAAVALLAVAGGWLLVAGLAGFRGAAGVAWRYGLANISRRGTESIVQIVAFALSLMVLLLLTVVRTDILSDWRQTLPENAPNYFLINIDPEIWPEIEAFIQQEFGVEAEFLPFIRGKIIRINETPIEEFEFADPRGANFIRQETNLTWKNELPESNTVEEGEWWSADPDGAFEISLEKSIAKSLGVGIGDSIGFNIGGEEFDVPLTSLRSVEWDSMQPNFYLMLSPGAVRDLPQTYIASLFIPPEYRLGLNKFVRTFPGITVFDLEVIIGQVRMVIDRASMAVQYVFLFTLLAGITVLLAAIQATHDERRFESALLHTLGASRSKILQGIAIEFTVLGGLAGALAAFGATAVGYVLAEKVFNLDYSVDPTLWLVGLVMGCLIVGVTGIFATRKAVNEPPIVVLRDT
jgi:putative ABC transport system permease protein